MRTALWAYSGVLVSLMGLSAIGAEPSTRGTLHLAGGDSIVGELQDAAQPNVLRWQSPGFATPFAFPMSGVSAVHFAVPDEPPKPAGDACLELVNGDRLFGSLVAWNFEQVEWELPGLGLVRVRREHIRRLLRLRDASEVIYLGPNSLADWEQSGFRRVEGVHLTTDQRGAFLNGNLEIPPQATIEFEISWTSQPDFVLAIGVDDSPKNIERAFRFEVWDGSLVIMRETDDAADVALLREMARGPGSVQLEAYLDQVHDRLIVVSAAGEQLADLTVPDGKSQTLPQLRLINQHGDLRLKRLCVTPWDGDPPPEIRDASPRIHRSNGPIIYGDVKAFDQDAQEFVVADGQREIRIRANDVGSIVLSPRSEEQPSALHVDLHNGMRLSGELIKIERGRLWLKADSVTEPLAFPVSELRTIHSSSVVLPGPVAGGKSGRLQWDGVQSHGALVAGRKTADVRCLAWHPRGSTTCSPLLPGVAGRIIYKDLLPPEKRRAAGSTDTQPRRNAGFLGTFIQALSGAAAAQPKARRSSSQQMLHLRSGDTIPCQVKRIDASGVIFETPLADAKFVPHEKVKAIELAGVTNTVTLSREKLKRLLTLPRIRRNNPPTHLIRSTNGDFLRARIQEMDSTTLTIEVRLDAQQLRRDCVAQIIWLHEDEWKHADQATSISTASGKTPVQALRSDGIRLTLFPRQLSGGTLSGESDVLGACQLEMEKVDQLLIGSAIRMAAARLEYGRWRLYSATDPQFVTADDGRADRPPGTESALVGSPAPDFELELLSGEKFRLGEQKGKVVVLDFWATWCGPCMQAMPQIDRIVHEFNQHAVQLVAVNLQERPEKITSALERLKLKTTVALDVDGAVAAKYAATAIPQTVIIDADGKIIRLFVGGGRQFGQQLHDALQRVLKDEDPDADPDAT